MGNLSAGHWSIWLKSLMKTFIDTVQYEDTNGKTVTETVSVNDITSLTKPEEVQQQKKAREQYGRKEICMCGDANCNRKPAHRCTYQMNYICCERQGKNCHFHHISKNTKPSKSSRGPRYNLSSPHIIDGIFSDFAKDIQLALEF